LRKKAFFKLDGVCALYDDKIKENTELKSELEQLRQKHSRTSQPRSGGRFVKKAPKIETVESACKENMGLIVTNENGHEGYLCGYDKDEPIDASLPFIIGLNNDVGWYTIYEADIVLEKYRSYKYCSYQDILKAKSKRK